MMLANSLSSDFPRIDVLIATTTELHLVILNRMYAKTYPINKRINSTVFIGHYLLVLYTDGTCTPFHFVPEQNNFIE